MVSQSKLNKEWQDDCDIVMILQCVEIFGSQFLIKFRLFCACMVVLGSHRSK